MNRTGKLAFIFLVLGGSAFATGCKASACPDTSSDAGGTKSNCVQLESLKRYNGTAFTRTGTFTSGKAISITSPNGDIKVDATAASGQITVDASPYDMQTGDDAGQQAAIANMNNVLMVTLDDASGTITVSSGGKTYLGADLQVHLPADFDAALTVNQTGAGAVTVEGSGMGSSTSLTASAGDIVAHNLINHVEITGGASAVELSATPSGPGNFVHTDVGDINASIATLANLTITAKTDFGGTVTVAPGWNANTAADMMSAGITLGDGSGKLDVATGNGNIVFHGN
jgi:hypothetical protein